MGGKKNMGEYSECSKCGNYFKDSHMAYIKPNRERDVFVSVESLCKRCIKDELELLTKYMTVPKIRKRDARWLITNVFKRCPNEANVEKVLFLCGLILKD